MDELDALRREHTELATAKPLDLADMTAGGYMKGLSDLVIGMSEEEYALLLRSQEVMVVSFGLARLVAAMRKNDGEVPDTPESRHFWAIAEDTQTRILEELERKMAKAAGETSSSMMEESESTDA